MVTHQAAICTLLLNCALSTYMLLLYREAKNLRSRLLESSFSRSLLALLLLRLYRHLTRELRNFLDKVVHMARVICLFFEDVCTCLDASDEDLALCTLGNLNTFLDDIISIPIFHHHVQRSIHLLFFVHNVHDFFYEVFLVTF